MAGKSKGPPPAIPPLEWIVASFGALIVLATLVYFTVDALRKDTPPDLVAQVVTVRPASDGWVAEIRVENRGDLTAAHVVIEGIGHEGERRTVTIDFVPGRSRRTAWLVFTQRAAHRPIVHVVSFGEP